MTEVQLMHIHWYRFIDMELLIRNLLQLSTDMELLYH